MNTETISPSSVISTIFLEEIKNSTPRIQELTNYMDADDEILPIAKYLQDAFHNHSGVPVDRIKYLYSPTPKSEGGRFTLTELFKRSEIEKLMNEQYDFVLTVFYEVWKDLTPENRVMVIDRALSGIEMGDNDIKKKAYDSKEYRMNLHNFGPINVLNLSDTIHMHCENFIQEQKEKAQAAKAAAKAMSGGGKKKRKSVDTESE